MHVDLPKLLASRAQGSTTWVRAAGRSMVPLFFTGDELLVERCGEASIERGDVAVMDGGRGRLIAHVAVSVAPLVTASYLGAVDQNPMLVLGRVVAVRRFGASTRLPPRSAVLFGHRALSLPSVQRAAKVVIRALLTSSVPLRRIVVGACSVRNVTVDELEAAASYAAGVLGAAVIPAIQSATDVVVAQGRGRWLGIGWRQGSEVICAVSRFARGLGIEQRIQQALA